MALRAAITSVRSDARDEGFFGGYTPSRPSTSADGRYLDGDWRGTAPKMANGEGRNHDRLAVASAVGEEERRCAAAAAAGCLGDTQLYAGLVVVWLGSTVGFGAVLGRSGTCYLGLVCLLSSAMSADMEVQFFCMPCDEMICALVGYGPTIYISFYLFVRISPFIITVVSSSLTI